MSSAPNKKKLEHLDRIRKKNEAKTTKTKLKNLARIAERKKVKQTRDSLIEKLAAQHLCSYNLVPIAKMHEKDYQFKTEEPEKPKVKFPKKLRCVSGINLALKDNRKRQANYYETGSSSSDEDENAVKILTPANDDLTQCISASIIADDVKLEPLDVEKEAVPQKSLKKSKLTSQKTVEEKAEELESKLQSEEYFKLLAKIKGQQILVPRFDAIETLRQKLPIHAEEQEIVETINNNTVTLICGETGSGKTTQIPQFLYESGYTSNGHLIGVTEPRRIAAISMAERVGKELCNPDLASYQIRFEGNRTDKTKILFMTDGVLLRELQTDVSLSKFSVIVIDEAHERSVYSDVLIGLLSRICVARLKRGFPLKLIIMSATLRLSDFMQKRLFPKINPKVIKVEARQFPVTVHFERKTPEDYLKASFLKVCKIHERLPEGGILVFLSGQREVEQLIQWLRNKFPGDFTAHKPDENFPKKSRKKRKKVRNSSTKENIDGLNIGNNEDMVVDYDEFGAADADGVKTFEDIDEDDEFLNELRLNSKNEKFPPLYCLPLYSLLSSEKQKMIFQPIPKGSRLCVIATNVAETSLTIPNIRYVIDSGREKCRNFDSITGVSQFCVQWISRASAEQRSGRAGRVQAGHAYRLFSSAVFEDLKEFAQPDILNQPIEQLVLHLKAMNFTKLLNFPFPTPPCEEQVDAAEQRLIHLGALEKKDEKDNARITTLGLTLSRIPLAPRFASLLARSNQINLMPFSITLVAVLSVREPLHSIAELRKDTVKETQDAMAEVLKQRRLWCSVGEARHLGDLCVLLNILGAADNEPNVSSSYLQNLGLRPKPYFEIRRLRCQLINVVNSSESLTDKLLPDIKLTPPDQAQMRLLRELMTQSLPEQIAKRVDRSVDKNVPKGAYKCQKLEEFVFIESTSMLYKEQPDYVLYQEIIQLAQKKCMLTVSTVEPEWIPAFVKSKLDC